MPKGSWSEISVSDGVGDSVTRLSVPRGAIGAYGVRQRACIFVFLMQYFDAPGASVDAARSMLLKAWDRAKFDCSLQKEDSCIWTMLICWAAPCTNEAG